MDILRDEGHTGPCPRGTLVAACVTILGPYLNVARCDMVLGCSFEEMDDDRLFASTTKREAAVKACR